MTNKNRWTNSFRNPLKKIHSFSWAIGDYRNSAIFQKENIKSTNIVNSAISIVQDLHYHIKFSSIFGHSILSHDTFVGS